MNVQSKDNFVTMLVFDSIMVEQYGFEPKTDLPTLGHYLLPLAYVMRTVL